MLLTYNVHRWYESGTGRYTRPDPLGLQVDSRLEPPTHPFAYVGSRPTRYKDRLGLFKMDDSCDCLIGRDSGQDKPSKSAYASLVNSVAQACADRLSGITDVALRRCVGGSCDRGTVICRDDCNQGQLGGTTDVVAAQIAHVFGGAIRGAKLCVNNWPALTAAGAGNVALHEWAHGCAWLHASDPNDPGAGVPGPHGNDF